MRYRKKPAIIEAVQYDGNNKSEIESFVGGQLGEYANDAALQALGEYANDAALAALQAGVAAPVRYLIIPTSVGNMEALPGDYIIKSEKGEFYPCKPDIFELTYEPVTE